jgi:hypothetical protein
MSVFAEAYGIAVDEALVEDVLAAQQAGVELMRRLAAQGDPRRARLVAEGELEREMRAVAWAWDRRHKFAPRQTKPH